MSWPKGVSRREQLAKKKPLVLPAWWPYRVICDECGAHALYNDLDAHRPDCTIMHQIRSEIHPLRRVMAQ